jgi:hypothetical protein
LLRFALTEATAQGHYSKGILVFSGASGLLTTILGIVLAFFPAQQITSVWWYEAKMFGITLVFLLMAAFFFFVYGRHKVPPAVV